MSKHKTFIIQSYPNGFSFEPMAIRLLESQANLGRWDDNVITALKAKAIKRNMDNVYFFPEQIASKKNRKDILDTADEWIKIFGCFSLAALRNRFQHIIHNLSDDILDFECFLSALQDNEEYKTIWYPPMPVGRTRLVRDIRNDKEAATKLMASHIEELFDERDTIAEASILERIPALDSALLSAIVKEHLPFVTQQKNSDLLWYCRQCLSIPIDLSEKILSCVQQIENVDFPVSEPALQLLLSLAYQTHFLNTYNVGSGKAFRALIAQHFNAEERKWVGGIFSAVQEKNDIPEVTE